MPKIKSVGAQNSSLQCSNNTTVKKDSTGAQQNCCFAYKNQFNDYTAIWKSKSQL